MNNLYIIILHNPENVTRIIGKKGKIFFKQGNYIYIGSAKKNPMARIERHLRKEKKMHWHIDYITQFMNISKILLYRNVDFSECELAQAVFEDVEVSFPFRGLGSSDCLCYSHFAFLSFS